MTTIVLMRKMGENVPSFALSGDRFQELHDFGDIEGYSWSFIELDPVMPSVFCVRATALPSGIKWSGESLTPSEARNHSWGTMYAGTGSPLAYRWCMKAMSLEEAIEKAKKFFVDDIVNGRA